MAHLDQQDETHLKYFHDLPGRGGVLSGTAVVLLPARGETPPPPLLLQPLGLQHGGVEGDVRQDSELDCRVNKVRLQRTSFSHNLIAKHNFLFVNLLFVLKLLSNEHYDTMERCIECPWTNSHQTQFFHTLCLSLSSS